MAKLQIILGSTRPTRNAERVVPWVTKRAEAHGDFDVEVLDLRDWRLPLFQEHRASIGDFSDPTYSEPIVRKWNRKLKEGEAFLFVTPEYNHSIPSVLKNAFDNVFVSWALRNKPGAFVGYSTGLGGGIRAIEHLALIAIEAELVPLRNTVVIPKVEAAFTEAGNPVDPIADKSLGVLLDDLAWWSKVLAKARAEGELPPAAFRRPPAPKPDLEET